MKRDPLAKSKIWQQHIQAAESFDGSVQDYCDKHGLGSGSFYQWRKKLKLSKNNNGSSTSGFLPVVVSSLESMEKRSSIASLPDPRWAAEFVAHLLGRLQ